MKNRIHLDFSGGATLFRGSIVAVSPSQVSPARAARLAATLSALTGVELRTDKAEAGASVIHVGNSDIPFAGLAETQGQGGDALVNLDASASDAELVKVIAHEAGHLLGTVSHEGVGLRACAYTNPDGTADYILRNDTITGKIINGTDIGGTDPYAKNLTISNGGVFYDPHVYSGGTVLVSDGGYISGGFDSGGTVRVYAGAVASGVKVVGGLFDVTGKAYDLDVQGGCWFGGTGEVHGGTFGNGNLAVRVSTGALFDGLKVSGGTIYVGIDGRGRLTNTVVTGTVETYVSAAAAGKGSALNCDFYGGHVYVSGVAIDCNYSGGNLNVYNGGSVSGGTFGKAYFNLSNGAYAENVKASGGIISAGLAAADSVIIKGFDVTGTVST